MSEQPKHEWTQGRFEESDDAECAKCGEAKSGSPFCMPTPSKLAPSHEATRAARGIIEIQQRENWRHEDIARALDAFRAEGVEAEREACVSDAAAVNEKLRQEWKAGGGARALHEMNGAWAAEQRIRARSDKP